MIPFLELVVQDLLEKKIDFSNQTIVFPGKRPILFFKNTLKKLGYVGVLPELITIEGWVGKVSGCYTISGINLWFVFYKIYQLSVPEPKSFQEFLKWAPTLLNDFNDLDKSMSSAKEFFYALASSERIEKWREQDWEKDNSLLNQQILFWKEMEVVYQNAIKFFDEHKKGYAGYIYKKAFYSLPNYLKNCNNNFIFLGFNALTVVEEEIITHCLNEERASIYWEADEYYLNDKNQEAGYFLRKYQKWKYHTKHPFSFNLNNFRKEKIINTYSVSNSINQVKLLGSVLKNLSVEEIKKTAIVLADENLLFPLLNSLPNNISTTNITMGMPLNYIPISTFFDNLILLQVNKNEKKYNNNKFYFQDLFNLFDATFIKKSDEEKEFISTIKKNNYGFISTSLINSKLATSTYLELLKDFETTKNFISVLIAWIDKTIALHETTLSALTSESLIHFSQLFKKLLTEIDLNKIDINFSTLNLLYLSLKNIDKIPFVGEPISGLQILGMLETRLLNFDRIYILDVNEGVISPENQQNSLIPFDFRKNFNLPTFNDKDAIYAYHFYRLLQGAKEVNLFYSEGISKMNNLEKSRYIMQLEIESRHKINNKIATPDLLISYKEATVIEKNKTIIDLINNLFKKGISASSIKSYIRNPLNFYLKKVVGVKETESVELIVAQNSMGTIIHNVLQELYKDYLNKILIPTDFIAIKNRIEEVINATFKINFKEGEFTHGKNHLIYKVVIQMVEKIIEMDNKLVKEGNGLIIEALELKLEAPFLLNNTSVLFKGEIDRIDSLNGKKRILDYKSGLVESTDLVINSANLEKLTTEIKYENAIQLIIYSYLYLFNNKNISQIFSGIYSVRNQKNGFLSLKINNESEITSKSLEPTLEKIKLLLEEMLDPTIAFTENENTYFSN